MPPTFPPTPAPGLGYGGAQYGYSPYGSGAFPRQPVPPGGGYGGAPYGYSSYGSIDITPPRVTSASSLDGYRIEVFFSESMRANTALTDPTNYTLTPSIGAPATVTSVAYGVPGGTGGYTSVILTHTGTTTGGTYVVAAMAIEDLAGNPIGPSNTATLMTFGDIATLTVTPTAGDAIEFDFFRSDASTPQDMLTEAEFSPGIEDLTSYDITTAYPIGLILGDVTHPVGMDASKASIAVTSMTAALYNVLVTPSDAIIYDGSLLPSAATGFSGVELGTGTSTATISSGLLLSKAVGDLYGWDFIDTSGKILPSSSYRVALSIDATTATFSPPLFDTTAAALSFSDGVVQVDIILRRIGGVDVINVVSGGFSAQIPASWSTSATTIELYRNQKADHYAVLVNGVPMVSKTAATFTGVPTISTGARFLLSTAYQIQTFKVSSLDVTSSQTVFTSAWNFLHSLTTIFIGSALLAKDRLMTRRGPLVKGWGDATPATKQDATIRVNGVSVEIDRINPYIGAIFPTVPIPLAPPGTNTIEADYIWFPSPPMQMAGLNTEGLVLNKWNLPRGHHEPSVSPTPATATGVMDTARFPLGVVLPPFERPSPIYIGHRYLGFEQAYTASLNSPTTLRLNQNPHQVSVPDISESVEGVSASFEGITTPPLAEDVWDLDGVDTGAVVGDGTYRLIDPSDGTFATGTAAVYHREENLALPVTANLVGRFRIESYTLDGIFTGVGFGFHDNYRLYLAGMLVINGLRHVGLLLDADHPQDVTSWEIGPSATVTITSSTTMTLSSLELPTSVGPGSSFQILTGSQAGIYTLAACGVDDVAGVVTITLETTTPFPADYTLYENDTAEVIFETLWDEALTTFRLIADVETHVTQLYIGGTLTGRDITVTDPVGFPADTSLLIPTGDKGRMMFGSLSRIATNQTLWSFNRYDTLPKQAAVHVRGIVVSAEMSDLPEDDPNHEWFLTNRFGYSEIDSSFDTLLLKSTSSWASGALDLSFGYARIEPLLTSKTFLDVDATFHIESGILGAGDAIIRARDDLREAKLATLLYENGYSVSTYRSLVFLPVQSLSGLYTPSQQGWTESSSSTLSNAFSVHGQTLTFTKVSGEEGTWYSDLDLTIDQIAPMTGGRIVEARLAITSYTAGTDDFVGPIFGCEAGTTTPRIVAATFKASPPRVILTSTGTEIGSFAFDWTDGEFHTYRLIIDPDTSSVSLVINDQVQGVTNLSLFALTTTNTMVFIGGSGSDAISVSEWDSLSAQALPTTGVNRTFGVWKGGDLDDIDSYEISRTDGTSALNSEAGATPVLMDWASSLQVRIHLDPTWGVSIYRPDIAPPPWFTGDFATQITDPTAAWINVEYRRLPKHDDTFGSVAFGALDPRSVTQQRWQEVRYRIYNTPDENYISPHHMVLNQYNVIHSGELLLDVTPEVVTITSLTSTIVSIRSAHMNADRVFVVQVDGSVVPTTAWNFDETTQLLTFDNPLPSSSYPVTVTFAPDKPVTTSYLCSQPLAQSMTLLNEGTPPVPMSQQAATLREVVSGSQINDPNDVLNSDPDFILNDPYQTVVFEQGEDSLYASLSFCTVDDDGDTGLLSIACDGPAPGMGFAEIALEGRAFTNGFSVPGGPGGPWGSSSPTITGSASAFDQTSILHVSGGSYVDGVLGPGTAVMYPNYPGPLGAQRGQTFGVNQQTRFDLLYTTPFSDTYTIPATADNTPATFADPSMAPNPDGTPGVFLHGAVATMETEYGATAVSRLGPWGGLSALAPESFLAGGGFPPSGVALTLNGGAALTPPTITNDTLVAAN